MLIFNTFYLIFCLPYYLGLLILLVETSVKFIQQNYDLITFMMYVGAGGKDTKDMGGGGVVRKTKT